VEHMSEDAQVLILAGREVHVERHGAASHSSTAWQQTTSTFSPPGSLARSWMESLYRVYTARCILIQGTIDCGQYSVLTTS
jgi:hypothetical protein